MTFYLIRMPYFLLDAPKQLKKSTGLKPKNLVVKSDSKISYLCTERSLFVSKEVQSVFSFGETRDIDVVQSLERSSAVWSVRFQHLYYHAESNVTIHAMVLN